MTLAGIEIEALSAAYETNGLLLEALQNINLEIAPGEFFCLLGPSGCGKSTLLSILTGLLKPRAGSVRWNGREIEGPGLDRAVVFQSSTLFPWMTAEKNLEFALAAAGKPKAARHKLANQFLEIVGLEHYSAFFPSQLSGGMQQRLALARAFALGSPLLLLDEPFGAVDALTRIYLQDLLLDLRDHFKTTVFMVTHDVDEAILLSDRVAVMTPRPGRIRRIATMPFPRPRKRSEISLTDEYQRQRLDLLHDLQAELLDVFAAQQSKIETLWYSLEKEEKNGPEFSI
jgi:NitT/TauT family transport system ATP-binding protein